MIKIIPEAVNRFLIAKVIVVVGLLLFVYADGFRALSSHGFNWNLLVPLIVGGLFWYNRNRIFSCIIKPNLLFGVPVTIFSVALIVAGRLSSTRILSEFSIIFAVYGLILILFGKMIFKEFFWPLMYLLLTSSLTEGALDFLTPVFRTVTAVVATTFSLLFGLHILRDATFIRLPTMTLNVADECSGLNHLLSLFLLSFPLAYFLKLKRVSTALLVLSSIPLAFFANGIRVTLIILYNYSRDTFDHGPANILVTQAGFFIGMFLLLCEGFVLDKNSGAMKSGSMTPENGCAVFNHAAVKKPLIFIIAILSVAAFIIAYYKIEAIPLSKSLKELSIAGFKDPGEEVSQIPFISLPIECHDELIRKYTDNDGNPFYVNIKYLSSQSTRSKIISHKLNPLYNNYDLVKVHEKKPFTLLRSKLLNSDSSTNILYTVFWTDGNYTSNRVTAKFNLLKSAIVKKNNPGALVIIGTNQENQEFILNYFVPQFLEALGEFLVKNAIGK